MIALIFCWFFRNLMSMVSSNDFGQIWVYKQDF